MKRGILVATLMMTAAGVASANLLTTGPQGVASPWPQPQPATEAARPMTTAGPEERAAAPAPAAPIAAPLTRKGEPAPNRTEGFGRDPPGAGAVPAEAAAAGQPAARRDKDKDKDKATEAKAAGQAGDKPGETSPDPAGEKAARAAIEADGYTGRDGAAQGCERRVARLGAARQDHGDADGRLGSGSVSAD